MHGSCGAECPGPHWLNRPGITSECGPEFALSEGTVHLLSTAFDASEVQGRSVLDQPPAGRIRCYLSDWGHHHQSLLSTFLCPESNQHRVIHLRWRRADKISNRVCQNFATFAWCVKGGAIVYLSLYATGLAFPLSRDAVITRDTAVLPLNSSTTPSSFALTSLLHWITEPEQQPSRCKVAVNQIKNLICTFVRPFTDLIAGSDTESS